MEIQCYAQRLLNPFRGVINVIRYQSAEAVTMDGVHWDIYVANEALSAGLKGKAQISDIRYGSWSQADGLKRGPIYPSDDFKRMELRGNIVFDYLKTHHQDVPFAFADHFECWLLDAARQPLALVHSVLTREDMTRDVPRQWRAGFAAEAQFRSSATVDAEHSATALASHINQRTHTWQWIARNPDGSGMGMAGGHDSVQGEEFAATAFPKLFLVTDAADPKHAALMSDYLHWQSPWLLLLDTLDEAERQHLETHARARAEEMVKQHRLYTALADPAQLRAAQVELVLREKQAVREVQGKVQPDTSPFYMEISPAGGEYT